MISTSEIEMGIEQRMGELVNLQDGRWTFMPQRSFLATTNFRLHPFLSTKPPLSSGCYLQPQLGN